MAPHSSRNKKEVKFRRSRSPSVPRKKVPRTEESYANIVLHYLSKLKDNLFHTPEHSKVGSNYYDYDRETSPKPVQDSHSEDSRIRQNALEIVNAALQYGCANSIIDRVGDYYIIVKQTTEQKDATRRPTPGPHASCKKLTKHSKTHRRSYNDDDYYSEDDDDSSTPTRRKSSRSNTRGHCSKCHAKKKSKRRHD